MGNNSKNFLRQREVLDNCMGSHEQIHSLGQKIIDDLVYQDEINQSEESGSVRISWEYLDSFKKIATMFDEAVFITSKDFVINCKIVWGHYQWQSL